jgi:hypothetical protein
MVLIEVDGEERTTIMFDGKCVVSVREYTQPCVNIHMVDLLLQNSSVISIDYNKLEEDSKQALILFMTELRGRLC